MRKEVYRELHDLEDKHWWFRGRRAIIQDVIGRLFPNRVERAVDIGTGTGYNLPVLAVFAHKVVGVESSEEAARLIREQAAGFEIVRGALPYLELPCTSDLITMFDVMEHIDDDISALSTVGRYLKPGGKLVMTVPALPTLWTEHDEAAHHFRRYTVQTLRDLVGTQPDLKIEKITYFNFFLFFIVYAIRKTHAMDLMRKIFKKKEDEAATDFFSAPKPVNDFLAWLFGLERFWIRAFNFPIGVSVLCVVTKVKHDD